MPLALIVMVVLTLLGTALWAYSMADLKQVTREEDKMQAFYYARSGAELVAKGIWDEIGQIDPGQIDPNDLPTGAAIAITSDIITFEGEDLSGEDLSGNIQVEVYKDNGDIVIKSTGTANGVSQTVILKLLKRIGQPYVKYWERES